MCTVSLEAREDIVSPVAGVSSNYTFVGAGTDPRSSARAPITEPSFQSLGHSKFYKC